MSLDGILAPLLHARTVENALAFTRRSADFSVVDGLRAPMLAALLREAGEPRAVLAVTPTGRESEALRRAIGCYLPDARVVEFPAWETLPHERLSPSAETVGRRIAALRDLRDWDGERDGHLILVASVRAALQPLAAGLADAPTVTLNRGGRGYDLAELT